jgi:hypothetical protein
MGDLVKVDSGGRRKDQSMLANSSSGALRLEDLRLLVDLTLTGRVDRLSGRSSKISGPAVLQQDETCKSLSR